jgi:hypothetical protein
MGDLTEIRVPKSSGTYADVLSAVGIATLVDEIEGQEERSTISDEGSEYAVSLARPLGDCSEAKLSVGYPYLSHGKAVPPPQGAFPRAYPYVEEKRKEDAWDKYQEQKTRESGGRRRRNRTGEELSAEPPRPDARFALMKVLNSLRSGSESWNDLVRLIQEELTNNADKFFRIVLRRIQGELAEMEPGRDWSVSVLQTFTPTAGKGVNRSKPDGAKLDNLNEPWADWFTEWCKYRAVGYVLNGRFA